MSGAPLRRSAFEAFACPFLYKAKYEDGYEDTSPPAQRGVAFHACAAHYIRLLWDAQQDHDPVLAQQALELGLSERPLAYDLILDIEQNLWPRHVERFRLDLEAFMLAEERQTSDDLTWMPDLVYAYPRRLRIKDWKTFFVGMTQTEVDEAFQTLFYLWRAMQAWPGFDSYEIEYDFPRLGYSVVSKAFTPNDLHAFKDRVQSLIAQIESARERNYWPAVPGDHCKYCTLACPAVDDPRRAPTRAATMAEAEALLLRATALDRQADQIREALRGFVEVHGAVEANGVAAYHKPVEKKRFPLADVIEVIADHGITDLSTLPKMEVSATTLKPLLTTKKRAQIGLDLLQRAVVTRSEKFVITKPADQALPPATEEAEEVPA